MSEERFNERQTDVRESVARLLDALAQPEDEYMRDAVIQRFEFTFEAVWKALKLYLEHQGHEVGSPRSALKKAFLEKLISDPDEADVWLQMLDDRNRTTHAYDEKLAERISQAIRLTYSALLHKMAERIQTLKWD